MIVFSFFCFIVARFRLHCQGTTGKGELRFMLFLVFHHIYFYSTARLSSVWPFLDLHLLTAGLHHVGFLLLLAEYTEIALVILAIKSG